MEKTELIRNIEQRKTPDPLERFKDSKRFQEILQRGLSKSLIESQPMRGVSPDPRQNSLKITTYFTTTPIS